MYELELGIELLLETAELLLRTAELDDETFPM
jgi:hypothetical protein